MSKKQAMPKPEQLLQRAKLSDINRCIEILEVACE